MTKKRDRFFALMGALLFLVSASALTVVVVVDSMTKKDEPTAQTTQATAETCTISPVSAPAEKLPADYVATADDTKELVSEDITVGEGAEAKNGDCLTMKYYGTLAKDGTKFDGNYEDSQGLQFQLGQGQVIPGWDQGIVGMKEGGVRRLVIPAELAYGDTDQGTIPANSVLVFLVKLVSVK